VYKYNILHDAVSGELHYHAAEKALDVILPRRDRLERDCDTVIIIYNVYDRDDGEDDFITYYNIVVSILTFTKAGQVIYFFFKSS